MGDGGGRYGHTFSLNSSATRSGDPLERLTIRRVTRPNAALLAQLRDFELEAFGELGLRTYDLVVMAEVGMLLVASVGDDVVGGCQLVRMLDEPESLFVVGFYLRPDWQGQRRGKELLGLVAEEARAVGATDLLLTVSPENERALRLYQGAGFASEALLDDFYGEDEHRQLLRWRFQKEGLHGSV